MGYYWWTDSPVFIGRIRSLNRLALGDYVLRLGRRWTAQASCIEGNLGGKDVLFEKALVDKFFQIFSEASAVNGLVSLTVVVRTVFFSSGSVGLYWIDLRCFTHGWSLMSLKASLKGSLNGVK